MFGAAAAVAVGWLVLFVLLLAAPTPPPRRRRVSGSGPEQVAAGDESPAVVSQLAGKLGRYGFEATLMDLADRGWFQLRPPVMPAGLAGQAGPQGQERQEGQEGRGGAWRQVRQGEAWGVPGPVMCVLCAEPPDEWLTPYERRVVAHVAKRAGARGEVPARRWRRASRAARRSS